MDLPIPNEGKTEIADRVIILLIPAFETSSVTHSPQNSAIFSEL